MEYRDSNTELLRLVCMMLIVMHHRLIYGYYSIPFVLECQGECDVLSSIAIILNGLCYIGANVFVLISGFYGIKFKWRGLLTLYLTCSFYALVTYLAGKWGLIEPDGSGIRLIIMPLSCRYWWFMTDYFILYMFSPLLNKAIDYLNKKEFIRVLVLFTIANVYFGYGFEVYNQNGYRVAQFVYLYLIAAYLRRYVNIESIAKTNAFLLYFGSALLFGVFSILSHYMNVPKFRSFAYHNPLLLIASISFFILFLRFHFKSKRINWMAKGAIGIYLFPETIFSGKWQQMIYDPYIGNMAIGVDVLFMITTLFVYAVLYCLFAMVFDRIRIVLLRNGVYPIFDRIDKYVENKHFERNSNSVIK